MGLLFCQAHAVTPRTRTGDVEYEGNNHRHGTLNVAKESALYHTGKIKKDDKSGT
ncbi:MAG: hypothetical protein ACRCTJ_03710 [Brevinema sp.]